MPAWLCYRGRHNVSRVHSPRHARLPQARRSRHGLHGHLRELTDASFITPRASLVSCRRIGRGDRIRIDRAFGYGRRTGSTGGHVRLEPTRVLRWVRRRPHLGGTRSGRLDPSLWSVAQSPGRTTRSGAGQPVHPHRGHAVPAPDSGVLRQMNSFFCGPEFGESMHWMEAFDDGGDYVYNSARIRQPFDFAGRTGTVVWDVDAKTSGPARLVAGGVDHRRANPGATPQDHRHAAAAERHRARLLATLQHVTCDLWRCRLRRRAA